MNTSRLLSCLFPLRCGVVDPTPVSDPLSAGVGVLLRVGGRERMGESTYISDPSFTAHAMPPARYTVMLQAIYDIIVRGERVDGFDGALQEQGCSNGRPGWEP